MTPVIHAARVTEPGLYRMPERDYHADPCPSPSLSRSIAQVLLDRSPRHAWTAHPRLNPDFEADEDNARRADIGSAAHALLLHQPTKIVEIDADAYRSKAAKEERQAAYDTGAIPLLAPDKAGVDAMVDKARSQLARHQLDVIRAIADPALAPAPYHNEIVVAWRDRFGDLWCRQRIDRLVLDEKRITIVDYKTTEMSAAPEKVGAAIFNNDYHLQDGFYRRGIRHVFPQIDRHEVELDFLFIVQEQKAPYEITVARIRPAGRVIGEKMASAAVRLWGRCMAADDWPGYPAGVAEVDIPPYHETRWTAREIEDPRFDSLPPDTVYPYEDRPYEARKLVEPV